MFSCPIKYVFFMDHVEGISSNAVIVVLFLFLKCVKWCSFMLGGAFTFYVSLRGNQRKPVCIKASLQPVCRQSHCTVIVQNGQMSHLSI